ncbi:sugar transferase [Candidatus Peregrinibacteria bacterium]|nr:sugar transferase [Candidatus Peregrinibacteria bacterium]
MKRSEIIFGLLKIPVDIIAILGAAITAYELRKIVEPIPGLRFPVDIQIFQPFNEYMRFSAIAAVGLLVIFVFSKMYSMKITITIWREILRIFVATSVWLMAIIAYFFVIREFPFSRLELGYTWLFTIVFVSFGRIFIKIIQRVLLRFGIGKINVMVLGETKTAMLVCAALAKQKEYNVLRIDNGIRTIADLETAVKSLRIDEIIQSKSSIEKSDILQFCRENQIIYRFIPDLVEAQQTNIDVHEINNIPIIALKPTPLDGWGRVSKRIFDIAGAGLGLIITSPIMLASAILIKTTSEGPVLFSQRDNGSPVMRIGQNSKPFRFFKFRTMRPGTDDMRYTLLASQNLRQNSPLVKIKNDPRVTRLGRFLRKTSIDELPQLLSVLRGHMSLVGPRPHLPEEVEKYKNSDRFVFTIKPGVTGMAQIKGRSDLDFETEMKLDAYYIRNWSIWLDIKILLKTLAALFKGYKE